MKRPVFQLLYAGALFCAFGMASADEGKDESGKGRERGYSSEREWKDNKHHEHESEGRRGDRSHRGHGSYFQDHGYGRLEIPPGHYPPPGECRIWYPDRPAGHQPPPGNCDSAPPGAWVIRHPHDHPGHVQVTVFEPEDPDTVLVVGEFEIASGAFVRVVLGY